MSVMNRDVENMGVQQLLKKMFGPKVRSFNICKFDDLRNIVGNCMDEKTYDVLHSYHCVDYDSMEIHERKWILDTVMEYVCKDDSFASMMSPEMLNKLNMTRNVNPSNVIFGERNSANTIHSFEVYSDMIGQESEVKLIPQNQNKETTGVVVHESEVSKNDEPKKRSRIKRAILALMGEL